MEDNEPRDADEGDELEATIMQADHAFGAERHEKTLAVRLEGQVINADAERMFKALADGGQVRTPLEQTFWAERFGVVTDRFGVPWIVNCEG